MKSLTCMMVGDGSVFGVDIDGHKKVWHLKEEIQKKKLSVIKCNADQLTLYVAKKDGKWITTDDPDVTMSENGEVPTVINDIMEKKENRMNPSYRVSNTAFGFLDEDEDDNASDGEIHVLVVLPYQQVAASCDETASLVPTAIHRHPERLKRWAAINAMVRKKNQDASQKPKSEDTNKKRKHHDIDRSARYLAFEWQDIKRIFNFESYEPKPSDVPDADIELLRARIVDLRSLYGEVTDGKEAKRLFFIAPILETVSRLLGDVQILVEEDVDGKDVHFTGHFEFVLQRKKKRICIVEAKREEMLKGMVQNVTELEALADVEELSVAYGIVTNYLEWRFLISEDSRVQRNVCTLTASNTLPSFEGLKQIVGKICGMLRD